MPEASSVPVVEDGRPDRQSPFGRLVGCASKQGMVPDVNAVEPGERQDVGTYGVDDRRRATEHSELFRENCCHESTVPFD
jgi:hypothetical protein